MNFDENNAGNAATAELEARVLAWICGEVPAAEAAEIERLAAERPELAEFKRQVEDAGRLVEEAVASDREPLRLSPGRRRALLRNLMPRQDLMTSGALVVALMAAVAWLGERTHYVAPPAALRASSATQTTLSTPPEPDEQAEEASNQPKKVLEKVAPEQQDYITAAPQANAFTQRVEPPAPPSDGGLMQIPEMGPGTGVGGKPFDLSQLDQPPVAVFEARPEYPYDLRRDGITGWVNVDFIVDSKGSVRNAVAAYSTNHGFDEAACRAVVKWKFRPGRKDGHPVYVHMQVPIIFRLSESQGN